MRLSTLRHVFLRAAIGALAATIGGKANAGVDQTDQACRVKAIIHTGRTGKCFYYPPDSEGYSRVDMSKPSRRWFCTEAEAEVAGCHDPEAD